MPFFHKYLFTVKVFNRAWILFKPTRGIYFNEPISQLWRKPTWLPLTTKRKTLKLFVLHYEHWFSAKRQSPIRAFILITKWMGHGLLSTTRGPPQEYFFAILAQGKPIWIESRNCVIVTCKTIKMRHNLSLVQILKLLLFPSIHPVRTAHLVAH